MLRWWALSILLVSCGCAVLPEIAHEPTLHNPFPQLSKVAVTPFFNLSNEPTVDSRQFALAYFNELQLVPGFEVVPVGVVERAIQEHKISLRGPEEVRRLAQILGVDAVVIGAVTDYSPYYPPRCSLQVEWYAANPCFHQIPPGYGLPWGTPEEEGIPGQLVLQAEMALAKEQMKTQTPCYTPEPPGQTDPTRPAEQGGQPPPPTPAQPAEQAESTGVRQLGYESPAAAKAPGTALGGTNAPQAPAGAAGPGLPPGWPDPRGFVPPPPASRPPTCWPSDVPVMRHTQGYNGHDPHFAEALSSYYYFREDARFGGWQSYLQRSDDFIRFCCHMHIWEMLTARGGAGETRVVWRWPTIR